MKSTLRPIDAYPITTRRLQVLRAVDVTPGMRRITLGGPELSAHVAANGFPVAAFRSDGFDDEFKIFLCHPDLEQALVPQQADGRIVWPRDPKALPRTYTVRRWDSQTGELDVDFVIHGVGPATAWARRVRVGDEIQIAGPKASGGHPAGADWVLVGGDETALPAIGRWLEEWPSGLRGQVFVEVGAESHRQDLPIPAGVELTWLVRNGQEAGTTTLLYDAIRAAEWPTGVVYAWVAGEALTLAPIRRWLRQVKELPKEQVEVTGYWRRQQIVVSEADPSLPDFDNNEQEVEVFHKLSELVAPFVLRIAATIDLGGAFAGRARTFAELVAATRAHPVGLRKLLRYLQSLDLVTSDDDNYQLAGAGRELENERFQKTLDLRGNHGASEVAAMLSLVAAVAPGVVDEIGRLGETLATSLTQDARRNHERIENEGHMANYLAGVLARALPLQNVPEVEIVGPAAAYFALPLLALNQGLKATVVAPASDIASYKQLGGQHERLAYRSGTVADLGANRCCKQPCAALLLNVLDEYGEQQAIELLTQIARQSALGIFVVADELKPAMADDHEYGHDLMDFALTGGGVRQAHEYHALFAAAGLVVVQRQTVGWGVALYHLTANGSGPAPAVFELAAPKN